MTSLSEIPAYKVKQMLSDHGYLSGFSIDETGASFSAPVFQIGYPRESASNVGDDSSIFAVQQIGSNGAANYHRDINMYLHVWTPTNGSSNFASYMARISEIMNGIKTNWRDSSGNVQIVSSDFIEGGETDSGRVVYYAPIRVVCDLD